MSIASENPSPSQLAWFAGWLEGEGSFSIDRRGGRKKSRAVLQASSTDRDVLETVVRIVGGSIKANPTPVGERRRKPLWHWSLRGWAATKLAFALYPFMHERRKDQCVTMLLSTAHCTLDPRSRANWIRYHG